jgi:hypothetical protein
MMPERIVAMPRALDEYEPGTFATDRYTRLHVLACNILNAFAHEMGVRGPVPPASAPAATAGTEDDATRLEMTVDAAEQMLAWMKREGESLTMAVRRCGFTGSDLRRLLDALAAQATELAALRARVETLHTAADRASNVIAGVADGLLASRMHNTIAYQTLRDAQKQLRAALAPHQTTGDEHG